ncbi:MAG: oligoendopeptidase F [Candidatus Obscuribacterales bacterium]|nr:oligoendopeptidase F [Candidatus Obscuribacterales bacterium]
MSTETITGLPSRSEVPVEKTWDLTKIYATDDAWEADFKAVVEMLPGLASYKGRLRRSGRLLLSALDLSHKVSEIIGRLYVYARMSSDVDTADNHYQGMFGRIEDLANKASAAGSFISPEILSLKPERLEAFIAKNEGLALYRHMFDELNRERAHVRTPEIEQLLAEAGQTFGGPDNIYTMFDNADLQFPQVEDESGKLVQLTHGNWADKWLENKDRDARRRAYEAMFGTYNRFRNMLSATYAAQVKVDIFCAKARKHASARQAALSGINVPVSVYDSLIDTVHANLPQLQRYLELRRRVMGLDKLAWYDLYVPLVGDLDMKVSYEDAQAKILKSLAVLGPEYVDTLRGGFNSRWVDVMENKNKKSGAYSWGSYGTPPYMLMNWQDSVDSMFTLTHEAGHSMHSWHSRKHQPYPYSGYTLFVAEVASTCNEALLAHYLLSQTDDPAVRKYILNHQMESIRLTLMRQTMFAEFEMIAHAKAEAGEALTPDVLCGIHLGLNKKYYEPAVEVDDLVGIEWARIPHFYSSFYVYQYATGISTAMSLAQQIITQGEPAVKRYLKFLSSGSSDYSMNLLRDAGVDLSTPAPISQAFDAFGGYLDQFEALL